MATDIIAPNAAAKDELLANMQHSIDQIQQQQALIIQALLSMLRAQWDSAQFGPNSAEAALVALNPTLHGKVNPVPFVSGR